MEDHPEREPNGHFRLARSIDLTAIITLIALLSAAVITAVTAYWGITAQQIKLDAKFELLDQRMKNDEAIAADKRLTDIAFSSEVRAGLSQLSQAVSDLRTLVASQDNAKRR